MNYLENLSDIKKLSGMPTVESIVERINTFLANYPKLIGYFDGYVSMFLEAYKNDELIIINGDYYNEYYTIRFIGTSGMDGYIMFPFEIIDSNLEVYNEFTAHCLGRLSENSSNSSEAVGIPANFENARINYQQICDELSALIKEMEDGMMQITGIRKHEKDQGDRKNRNKRE